MRRPLRAASSAALLATAMLIHAIARAAGEVPPEEPRAALVQGLLARHFVPRARAFAAAAPILSARLDGLCRASDDAGLAGARSAWRDTMLAWEALDAVEYGPVLDRRSTFRIDFWPTRPSEVESVARAAPASADLLERIASPAKGLPALEWLLWAMPEPPPVQRGAQQCGYALLLAQGIEQEAAALEAAFAAQAAGPPAGVELKAAWSSLFNQLFGGVEVLRGKNMERPATLNRGRHFPRVQSGYTTASWAARWAAVRDVLTGPDEPGAAAVAPWLRRQGRADEAVRLETVVVRIDGIMSRIDAATPEAAREAGVAMAELEGLLESAVAPAVEVTIGFHGFDGD